LRRFSFILPFACALTVGCNAGDKAGGNSAQPSDAAAAEGSIDDRMTDIDAAQIDGPAEAHSNGSAQPAGQASRRAVRDTGEDADQSAEAVAAE
jgi:hypothetical protein